MAWKLPANPSARHPNKKFYLPRKTLYHFRVIFRMSPKHISEVHQEIYGRTIHPQGVREYLKAYGFYHPPAKEQGRYIYSADFKGIKDFMAEWEKVRENLGIWDN